MQLLVKRGNLLTILRKIKLFFILSLTLIFQINIINVQAKENNSSFCVIEQSTGSILYQNNAHQKMPMASTTKIMTALLILENHNIDQIITVPNEAVGIEGSSIYLKKDERISLKDLLYGLMMRSGNDAANALAIYSAGSIEKFATKMNEKARDIGANDTHFVNPSGLHDSQHYTTAYDLAIISRYAMNNAIFREIVSSKHYKGDYRSYTYKNKFLNIFDGANGIKTGYTRVSGRCLVSSAKRNDMQTICVVLNCSDMYERSVELLNYAYDNFTLLNIKDKLFFCNGVNCKVKDDANFLVNKKYEINYILYPNKLSQNIKKGYKVGKIKIYNQNNLIFTQNLYSIEER